MLIAVSMAVAVASVVALLIKRTRIIGAIGLACSLVAVAVGFSRMSGDAARFEGALGAVQILSLTGAPETTTPDALQELAAERCGVRSVCHIVIHPDSDTAQRAIADGAAEQGAVAVYAIDMHQGRTRFVTRCGVWTDDPDDCFTLPVE